MCSCCFNIFLVIARHLLVLNTQLKTLLDELNMILSTEEYNYMNKENRDKDKINSSDNKFSDLFPKKQNLIPMIKNCCKLVIICLPREVMKIDPHIHKPYSREAISNATSFCYIKTKVKLSKLLLKKQKNIVDCSILRGK